MNNKTIMILLVLICCFLFFDSCNKVERPCGLISDSVIVVTAHPEASKIGLNILKKGGNAFDAMVAVEFALAVCYPSAGNIAGGGFMVYRLNDGSAGSLDYREKAPMNAHRDMYLDLKGNVIKNLSTEGCLSVAVPGTVDGMLEVYKRFGKLPFKDLIQPAIDIACNGVVLTELEANKLNNVSEYLLKHNRHIPALISNKEKWQKGDTLKQIELAKTLERIRDHGRAGFYEGLTAQLIVEEMKAGGGIITYKDLKNYKSIWRQPIIGQYKKYRIITMPPPSSGGVALMQLLGMVEKYDIGKYGFNNVKTIQLMVEAEKRVYADRAKYLGDPDFYAVPVTFLLDKDYLSNRISDLNFERATPSNEIRPGIIEDTESIETTHYTIVDLQRNAVAVTTTLNSQFGSKVVVKGGGFLLNNQMDDFSIKEGVPNIYGLVGGDANAIAPNKRMLSSMTPTIIEKDNNLFMTVGTPGGSTIITSVFQVILNVIEHKMTAQEAVNAKRFHHQLFPDTIQVETKALSDELITLLEKHGYSVKEIGNIGRVEVVLIRNDGSLEGAADPRGDDTALGF